MLSAIPAVQMIDVNMAIKSAENDRLLRKQGITIRKTIDMLIATYCKERDAAILHNDRDFELIARGLGLQVIEV